MVLVFLKLKYVSIDGDSGRSNKLSFCDCRVGEIQLAANLEPRERSQVF